jgi:hypothetical protein
MFGLLGCWVVGFLFCFFLFFFLVERRREGKRRRGRTGWMNVKCKKIFSIKKI